MARHHVCGHFGRPETLQQLIAEREAKQSAEGPGKRFPLEAGAPAFRGSLPQLDEPRSMPLVPPSAPARDSLHSSTQSSAPGPLLPAARSCRRESACAPCWNCQPRNDVRHRPHAGRAALVGLRIGTRQGGVALMLDIDLKLREQPAVADEVSILSQAPSVTECESSELHDGTLRCIHICDSRI